MRRKRKNLTLTRAFILLIFIIIIGASGYFYQDVNNQNNMATSVATINATTLGSVPAYTGSPYMIINNNTPSFNEDDYTTTPFETYSKLDSKGRCGVAYANICKQTIPDADDVRESLSSIIPSGWHQTKYEGIVEGNYLYNRCHLIGYQLAGENANEENLITGTRYMNVEGMLPFEDKIADYIENNPNNHVLYRVTPIFAGDNMLASGVQMEAYSIEDKGKGISFNVYVYNVQPGIIIDYVTGESKEE